MNLVPEKSKNRDAIRGITGSVQTMSLGNDANAFLVLSSTTALDGNRTAGTYANVTGTSDGAVVQHLIILQVVMVMQD